MAAQILDGKIIAQSIRQHLTTVIQQHCAKGLRAPSLAVILIGEDPASQVYVKNKRKACDEVGIRSLAYDLNVNTSQTALLALIKQLADDPHVDGILVQLPLPPTIQTAVIIDSIPPHKDVDGFHPFNIGCLMQRRPILRPCTPYGIMTLLAHHGLTQLTGLHAVVVGASNHVGRPMVLELLLAKCTVTICHRFTAQLAKQVQQADLLIVAIGNRKVICSTWIKPGAIVVDVGIHRQTDGTLTGDLEFETAQKRASWITPVPGGVGPMTVAMLLQNTVYAATFSHKKT